MKYLAIDLGVGAEVTSLVVIHAKTWEFVETRRINTQTSSESVPIYRTPDGRETRESPPPPVFNLVHIERMPAGTGYPDIVARTKEIYAGLRTPNLEPMLVIDATGVGKATTDLFKDAHLNPYLVSITAGDEVVHEGMRYKVPKRELISTAQVILQTGRLKIARELSHGPLLVRELQNFRMTIDLKRPDVALAWREGANDDLVLALATGLWIARKHDGIPRGISVIYYQRTNKYLF